MSVGFTLLSVPSTWSHRTNISPGKLRRHTFHTITFTYANIVPTYLPNYLNILCIRLQVACTACYCNGVGEATAASSSNATLPFDYYKATTAKTQCKVFSSFSPFEAGVNTVIAILIALVNGVLGMLIRVLTKFERHRSHTEEHAAQFHKTAIAQYLNTSISPLIASAEIRWLAVVFGGVVFQSGYPDFTTNWCVPCCPAQCLYHCLRCCAVPKMKHCVDADACTMRVARCAAHCVIAVHEYLINVEPPVF